MRLKLKAMCRNAGIITAISQAGIVAALLAGGVWRLRRSFGASAARP